MFRRKNAHLFLIALLAGGCGDAEKKVSAGDANAIRREGNRVIVPAGSPLASRLEIEQAPPGTSRVNFTTSGAIGAHFLRSKYNVSAEVRFMHISNAGLSTPNPGINTLQFRIGFGRFTQPQ